MNIHLHYDRAAEIFNEMAASVEAFKGIAYDQLKLEGTDIRVFAAPTIPKLEQHSNLIFHKEILEQSDKATLRENEKAPAAKV